MGSIKLEPGWLERDVVQAVRRTQELDEEKSQARSAHGNRRNDDRPSKPDLATKS
jgi:hypothetical protein